MDAVVVREAGGFGDVLQLGSIVPLLRADGYTIHFYLIPDPAIMELAKLIRGVSYVHPLKLVLRQRRNRVDRKMDRYGYLRTAVTHGRGVPKGPPVNKLLDMFCPAWCLEQEALERGLIPGASRAQAFVMAAGYHPVQAQPARLKVPEGAALFKAEVKDLVGPSYMIFAPWARDNCRCFQRDRIFEILKWLPKKYGPVVLMAYAEGDQDKRDIPGVYWFPQDFSPAPSRLEILRHTVELVRGSKGVLAVDSFHAHLATALDKRTVSIDGPTLVSVNLRHCAKVTACSASESPGCAGCYYRKERGFVDAECRAKGCRVIGSITDGDLLSSLERAF